MRIFSLRSPVPTWLAVGGVFGVFLVDFRQEARAQDRSALALFLSCDRSSAHGQSGRSAYDDLDGGIGGVDALAAGAGRAADVDFDRRA